MKKLTSLLVLGLFMLAFSAGAQAGTLPSPGILPGSPWFFLDRLFEGIGNFFTFGDSAKGQRFVKLAEERLAEAQALVDRGDANYEQALELYEQMLEAAQKRARGEVGSLINEAEARVISQRAAINARVAEATSRHFAVLEDVMQQVPEEARAAVANALEVSKQGQAAALTALSDQDPLAAVQIGTDSLNERLQKLGQELDMANEQGVDAVLGQFERVLALTEQARIRGEEAAARFGENLTEVLGQFDGLKQQADAQVRSRVEAAKDRALDSQLSALRDLAVVDPEAAVAIFAQAAERRLAAVMQANQDQDTQALEENLEDYDKYAQFGEEIAALAQGLRTGEITVEELVRRATSHHLEVLEEVRQTLPAQAQPEFQRALDSARRVQEQRPSIPADTTAPSQPGDAGGSEIPDASEQRGAGDVPSDQRGR